MPDAACDAGVKRAADYLASLKAMAEEAAISPVTAPDGGHGTGSPDGETGGGNLALWVRKCELTHRCRMKPRLPGLPVSAAAARDSR